MKKVWILLAVALGCIACEKEDKFTMPENELVGSYWVEDRITFVGYQEGKYVSESSDEMDGFSANVYYFPKEGAITIYSSGYNPHYSTMDYTYDKEQRLLVFNGWSHQLVRLTPEQMVWTVERNSESKQMTYTYYYERFEPDAKWFEQISHYEDRTGVE